MANELKSVSLIAYSNPNAATISTNPDILIHKGYVDNFFGTGTWDSKKAYSAGDIVVYNGILYKVRDNKSVSANVNGNQDPATDYSQHGDNSTWTPTTVFNVVTQAVSGISVSPASGSFISVGGNSGDYTIGANIGDGLDVVGVNNTDTLVVVGGGGIEVGEDGVSLAEILTWSTGLEYQTGCLVRYEGVLYQAKDDSLSANGNAPGTTGGRNCWTPITQKPDTKAIANVLIGSGEDSRLGKSGTSVTQGNLSEVEQGDVFVEVDAGSYVAYMYVGPVDSTTNYAVTTAGQGVKNEDNWVRINYAENIVLSTSSTFSSDVANEDDTKAATPAAVAAYVNDNLDSLADTLSFQLEEKQVGLVDKTAAQNHGLSVTSSTGQIIMSAASTQGEGSVQLVDDIPANPSTSRVPTAKSVVDYLGTFVAPGATVKNWTGGTQFNAGDVTCYNGSYYICTATNGFTIPIQDVGTPASNNNMELINVVTSSNLLGKKATISYLSASPNATVFSISHGLKTKNVIVQVYDNTTGSTTKDMLVLAETKIVDANTVKVGFASKLESGESYTVLIYPVCVESVSALNATATTW